MRCRRIVSIVDLLSCFSRLHRLQRFICFGLDWTRNQSLANSETTVCVNNKVDLIVESCVLQMPPWCVAGKAVCLKRAMWELDPLYCKRVGVLGAKGIRTAPRELYWENVFRGALGSVGSKTDPTKPSGQKAPPWLLYIPKSPSLDIPSVEYYI